MNDDHPTEASVIAVLALPPPKCRALGALGPKCGRY